MGRKPKAAKAVVSKSNVPKNVNPSTEMLARQPKMQNKSTGLCSMKKAGAMVRRSERLQNVASPAQNRGMEPVVEEVNLCESEKEDEPHAEENPPEPEPEPEPMPVPVERRLEESINYLVQTVEELKSEAAAAKRFFKSKNPAADLKYKSMYIDSHMKIEALTNENHELSKKLDVALGKIEAYGEVTRVCSELLEKLKDVILASNMASTAEAAWNLLSQAKFASSPPDNTVEPNAAAEIRTSAKRKKCARRK